MGKLKILNILSAVVLLAAWALFLTEHRPLAYMAGFTSVWLATLELNRQA